MNEWLEQCPQPVIAKVMTDATELRFMVASAYAYEEGTLVVTTIETLKSSIFKQQNNETIPCNIHAKRKGL